MKEALISLDCDPNSYILLGVFNCHGVSGCRGPGGVYNRTSRRLSITCAFPGTRPNTLKALRQFSSVNTSKNASLKARRKPSLLI